MPGTPITGLSPVASNGAVMLSDTVAPNGNVVAPPLSRYQQVSGAATKSGAQEWIKESGTGATGWVAGADSDTGWREISYTAGEARWTAGSVLIRRIGKRVFIQSGIGVKGPVTLSSIGKFWTIAAGFRNGYASVLGVFRQANSPYNKVIAIGAYEDDLGGQAYMLSGAFSSGDAFSGLITYTTDEYWPSSLPGSAA
jgi:hypothetical protein